MSNIQCLTLISDQTDEFPKNANNSFKVRLPERLSLQGDQWYATLMFSTVPEQGQSTGVIATDPHTNVTEFRLQDIQRGQSLADTWSNRGEQLRRGLKRKAPALAWKVGKHQAKRTAKNTYKRATQRVRDIFGLRIMVRIGGFLKTQNRIQRHRARGRFISPYQIGGTIFGKSTMARHPLMHTCFRLLDPHSMMIKNLKQRRKMKGGTLFDKSKRMCYPWMYPSCRVNPKWMITMARRRNAIKRKRR